MTEAVRAPGVCDEQLLLPLNLFLGVLRMEPVAGAADLSDVQEAPECALQQEHPGAHHGLVLSLVGRTTGAVWAVWTDLGVHLVQLPDCPASTSDGMTACTHYDGHPGRHSWGLADPRSATPAIEDEGRMGVSQPLGPRRVRTRPSTLRQEPEAVKWARERAGLTKRALAGQVGISEQLMGEIESGWRSATHASLIKIAEVLSCPRVVLERRRQPGAGE